MRIEGFTWSRRTEANTFTEGFAVTRDLISAITAQQLPHHVVDSTCNELVSWDLWKQDSGEGEKEREGRTATKGQDGGKL